MSYFWKFHLISSFGYKVIEAVRVASFIGKCDMHGKNRIVCSVTSTIHNCLKYVPTYGIFCVQWVFPLIHRQGDEHVGNHVFVTWFLG